MRSCQAFAAVAHYRQTVAAGSHGIVVAWAASLASLVGIASRRVAGVAVSPVLVRAGPFAMVLFRPVVGG